MSERGQYGLLLDYAQELKKVQHIAELVTFESQFKRIFIFYREGLQSWESFNDRGLQLDGTFLKNSSGGKILLF